MQAAQRKHRKPVFTGNLRKVREKETKDLTGENGFIGTGKAKKQIAPKMKNAVAPREVFYTEYLKWQIVYIIICHYPYCLYFARIKENLYPTGS